MIFSSEANFLDHLNSQEIFGVYFVYGKENYLKKLYKSMLIKKVGCDGLNTHEFDLSSDSFSKIKESAMQLPLMAERLCLIVKFEAPKLNDTLYNALASLIADVSKPTIIILIDQSTDARSYKNKQYKHIISLAENLGAVIRLTERSLSGNINFVNKKVKDHGKTITQDAARELVDICGGDLSRLNTEVQKIVHLVPSGGQITKEIIHLLLEPTQNYTAFNLLKAIITGNNSLAFEILAQLEQKKEEPIKVLAALSMGFIDIYRVKVATVSKITDKTLSEDFKYKGKEFRLNQAKAYAKKYSLTQIETIIKLITQTDYQLKSSSVPKYILLNKLVIDLLNKVGD